MSDGPDLEVVGDDSPLAQAAHAAVQVRHGRMGVLPAPPATRVLTVANQKGGVGKTTCTVNLAAALAMQGAKVLVVDLDPQGNASTALGVDHHAEVPSVYDVLINGRRLGEVVVPVAGLPGLWCAPATLDLAGAEIELVSAVAREHKLRRALQAYLPQHEAAHRRLDYVLVDCPPSLGLLTLNALVGADEVLIPIQCEYYALEGLGQLVRTVELVTAELNPALHISTILLTMYDARTRLSAQVAAEVRTHFGRQVLPTAIPRSVRISEAPSYGQTVLTYDPGSSGALCYLQAARELATGAVDAEGRIGDVNQRRGLGRGLGALIPPRADEAAPVPDTTTPDEQLQDVGGVRYTELPLDAITPNPRQPRTVFDEESLAELVHSIREIGLLQPVVVRPADEARYELVAGERRWRAAAAAGLDRIPALVRDTADDALLRDALLENLHRSQLNALEEAAAYQQLLDDFGCTQDELATRLGRSRPQVSNTLRLLRLPAPVQRRVAAGVLSAGHARALLGLDDQGAMEAMAARVVAEGLSVRSVEELVAVGAGDGRARTRTPRPRGAVAPGLVDIGERLSERLETRVRVEAGKVKGKVTIEFATLEDLRRIVALIDPES